MRFQAHVILREYIDGLFIRPELFGATHEFASRIGRVSITLPNLIKPGQLEQRETLVKFDGHPDHTWYEVCFVEMRIDLDDPIEFQGSDDDFNGMAVIRSTTAAATFAQIEATVVEVWDLWKRTLRWSALAPEIAFNDVRTAMDATRGRGFKVVRSDDGVVFRNHGGSVSTTGGGKVVAKAWAAAQASLASGRAPPVWIDFLMDAHRRSLVGDVRGAVVNAAIAAETVIRARLAEVRPPLAKKVIERKPLSEILSGWETLTEWTTERTDEAGRQSALCLLRTRNAILHQGASAPQSRDNDMALSGLSRFVLACDAELANIVTGVARPEPVDRAFERLTQQR